MKKIKYYLLSFMLMFIVMFSANVFAADNVNDYSSINVNLLNQDPDPAEPGKYLEVRWQVQKEGNNEIKDLTFELDVEYPFTLDKSENKIKTVGDFIGYSDEKSYYTLFYKLRVDEDALEDTYDVTLRYKFNNEQAWNEEEFDIRVGDREAPEFVLGAIKTSPTKLVGDVDEAEIVVNIENIGDGKAENVKAEFILPEGFESSYSFSNIVTLGSIEAGSNGEAKFYVDIDEEVQGGLHSGKIRINYKEENDDENEYKTVILPFDVQVKNRPVFEIESIETIPSSLYPGADAEVHIKIKNVGGKDAESVSIRAFKDSSQPFDFEDKSDYIGKINPGETGESVLKLSVDEDATPKKYILDLEIRSIDGDLVILQEKTINLDIGDVVRGPNGNNPSKMPLILGAGVLIIVPIAGYLVFFRKKSSKKKK